MSAFVEMCQFMINQSQVPFPPQRICIRSYRNTLPNLWPNIVQKPITIVTFYQIKPYTGWSAPLMSPAMYAIGIAMKLAIVLSGCMADFV
jgi:hypothetical protein